MGMKRALGILGLFAIIHPAQAGVTELIVESHKPLDHGY
jgi:hypothetical protein